MDPEVTEQRNSPEPPSRYSVHAYFLPHKAISRFSDGHNVNVTPERCLLPGDLEGRTNDTAHRCRIWVAWDLSIAKDMQDPEACHASTIARHHGRQVCSPSVQLRHRDACPSLQARTPVLRHRSRAGVYVCGTAIADRPM